MLVVAYPKVGNKFVLTEKGNEIGRVRFKFTDEKHKRQYSYSSPQAWLDKGWITEEEDNDGNKA